MSYEFKVYRFHTEERRVEELPNPCSSQCAVPVCCTVTQSCICHVQRTCPYPQNVASWRKQNSVWRKEAVFYLPKLQAGSKKLKDLVHALLNVSCSGECPWLYKCIRTNFWRVFLETAVHSDKLALDSSWGVTIVGTELGKIPGVSRSHLYLLCRETVHLYPQTYTLHHTDRPGTDAVL